MAAGNPYQGTGAPAPNVPNYLVQSILATVCCCLPLGIVAIVYAAQVNGKVAAGDFAGAMQASNNAKMWSYIAIGLGLLINVIYIGFVILGGVAGTMAPQVQP
jgi:hypothetical protein